MDGLESDGELVHRALAGESRAFEALVLRYQGPVYNAAYRVTGHPEDARDVAQTTFLKVAEHLREYDNRYKFFSWIFRIAVNEAINCVGRRRPEDPLDDGVDFEAPDTFSPEAEHERRRLSGRVQQALCAMKPEDRAVITLRHFAECSYQEIGEILGLDDKAVKWRLHDARQRLAQQLDDLKVR
jgi:RNA polymerase sigma-70 factor (ECF subfamily)